VGVFSPLLFQEEMYNLRSLREICNIARVGFGGEMLIILLRPSNKEVP